MSKKSVSDELRDIASDAARKYFVLADAIADSLTEQEVLDAARQPPGKAPMFMHMVAKFTEAQVKSNARTSEDKKLLSVNIGTAVFLPPRRTMDDVSVVDVEEVDTKKRLPPVELDDEV